MKKIMFLVVDALTAELVVPRLKEGALPHMASLADAGQLYPECYSIFPSITPAALTSLVTGRYPVKHGIAGAYWYDNDADHVAYYGDDIWGIMHRGFGNFMNDFLFKLNRNRLQAPTLFETIEKQDMQTACLNFFIYHGLQQHHLKPALLLKLAELFPHISLDEPVYGASTLVLGDFLPLETGQSLLDWVGHPQHRFGFDDDTTAKALLQLIESSRLPQLTVAYFPDNDFNSHKKSPAGAFDTIQHFDDILGNVIDAQGGLAKTLEETVIIIVGDHSQSNIADDNVLINLEALLDDFQIAPVAAPWQDGDELAICPNLRTAQLYLREPNQQLLERVTRQIITDDRVDQVIWRDLTGYHVLTADHGLLSFTKAGSHRDAYGNTWDWQGELATVDGQVSGKGELTFEDYPNAFERITSVLDLADSGHIWVTAKIGYEVGSATTPVHTGGGSHGSLHRGDSVVPLFVGTPEPVFQNIPRTIDVAPLCLQLLDISTP